jgi:hypothetical protein
MSAQGSRHRGRLACFVAPAVAAILLWAAPAAAVILQPDSNVPADRPPDEMAGRFGTNASCVVIGTEYVLTTRHQLGGGSAVGATVEVAGNSYTITDAGNIFTMTDPNVPDMMIVRLPGAGFTQYAKIYTSTDEIMKTVVIGGYGKGRGDTLYFHNDPNIPFGYAWDSSGNTTLRWGQNKINGSTASWDALRGFYTTLLYDDFDEANKTSAVAGEAALAEYDSGCGWFRKIGSDWYVIGLGWGVDHPDTTSSWYDDPNTPGVDPDKNYAIRISDYDEWINGVIPEPGSLALLAAGAAILAVRRRRCGNPHSPVL